MVDRYARHFDLAATGVCFHGAVHHVLVSNLRGKIWEIVRISSEQQIFELCIRALGQEEAMSPASVDSTNPIR